MTVGPLTRRPVSQQLDNLVFLEELRPPERIGVMFRVTDAWIGACIKQQSYYIGVSLGSSEVQWSHVRVPMRP